MAIQPHLGAVRLPPLVANRDEVLWPAMLDLAAHSSWRRLGEYAEDGVAVWSILREG